MAEDKKDGKAGSGLLKVALEGTAEAFARMAAEKGLATLFGGAPSATPAAGTTEAASGLDIRTEALRVLTREPEAVNAYFKGEADAAQRTLNVLNNLTRRR